MLKKLWSGSIFSLCKLWARNAQHDRGELQLFWFQRYYMLEKSCNYMHQHQIKLFCILLARLWKWSPWHKFGMTGANTSRRYEKIHLNTKIYCQKQPLQKKASVEIFYSKCVFHIEHLLLICIYAYIYAYILYYSFWIFIC